MVREEKLQNFYTCDARHPPRLLDEYIESLRLRRSAEADGVSVKASNGLLQVELPARREILKRRH